MTALFGGCECQVIEPTSLGLAAVFFGQSSLSARTMRSRKSMPNVELWQRDRQVAKFEHTRE
jgi:hypothetical protein